MTHTRTHARTWCPISYCPLLNTCTHDLQNTVTKIVEMLYVWTNRWWHSLLCITDLCVVSNGCFIVACCVLFISLQFDGRCCLLALSLSCPSLSHVCLHCFHERICYTYTIHTQYIHNTYTMLLFQCQPKLHHHTGSMMSFFRLLNTELLFFLLFSDQDIFPKNTNAFYF